MKKGPEQSSTKNAPKKSSFWAKAVTSISVATSAMVLACTPPDMSKKTTPEIKNTVMKIKHQFAKFCGPEKEVNGYAEDICVKGTIRKLKEEGMKCVECEREVEVIE